MRARARSLALSVALARVRARVCVRFSAPAPAPPRRSGGCCEASGWGDSVGRRFASHARGFSLLRPLPALPRRIPRGRAALPVLPGRGAVAAARGGAVAPPRAPGRSRRPAGSRRVSRAPCRSSRPAARAGSGRTAGASVPVLAAAATIRAVAPGGWRATRAPGGLCWARGRQAGRGRVLAGFRLLWGRVPRHRQSLPPPGDFGGHAMPSSLPCRAGVGEAA